MHFAGRKPEKPESEKRQAMKPWGEVSGQVDLFYVRTVLYTHYSAMHTSHKMLLLQTVTKTI